MNIHEYQAKRLLKGYGVAVPRGVVAFSPAEAEAAARFLGGQSWAVKAQIHAGDRGAAGGVVLVYAVGAVKEAAAALLGRPLTTRQTGPAGKLVRRLYIEEGHEPVRELYLAALLDRSTFRVTFLAASEGGTGIEAVAAPKPGTVLRMTVDPRIGVEPARAREFVAALGLAGAAADAVAATLDAVYDAFVGLDAALIEINPLAVMADGRVLALDASMVLDDNALFRHKELEALRDEDEAEAAALEAARHEINFVTLDGDVGCVVNGAGLAMATLDLLRLHGVAPANFMDIRPVATREHVATGFRMMLANPNLKCILVNIFGGGIMRCDLIAEGMVAATRAVGLRVPLIVRFAGTNAEIGCQLLRNAALAAAFAEGLTDAAEKVAQAAAPKTAAGLR